MAEEENADEEVVSEEDVETKESLEEIESISDSGENEVAESLDEGEASEDETPSAVPAGNLSVGTLTTPTVSGETQTIVMNPYATGGQVIMVGQPSSAPGFIGVVCIILGVINVFGIGSVWILEAVDPSQGISIKMKIFDSFSSAVAAVTLIIGGIWLKERQRRGVHMLWISIVLSLVLSIIGLFIGGDSSLADASGNSLSSNQALGFGVTMTTMCNGICFAIVSIPLMVSNSGLDDSSLFGSNNRNDYVKQY